jgi:DHA3 family macrolide efflux protein-like MFS transporter
VSYLKKRVELFSHPGFGHYVAGCSLAMFGNGLTYIVMTWVLMNYQSSVSSVALLMGCFWLPNIALGPLFGVIADRINRKMLLLIANGLRALILSLFALFAVVKLNAVMIYALAFITGSILSLYIPAAMSFVREIVPKEKLLYANATVDVAYEVGAVAGMGVAGFVLAMTSVQMCFLINAGCYAFATLLIMMIKHEPKVKRRKKVSMQKDFLLGFKYLTKKIPLLMIYTVQMLFFVSYMTAPVLLAPFAKTVLHTTVGQFGWIEAAMSLGAVVGGIASPYFAEKLGFLRVILIETIIAIISFILFSHNTQVLLSVELYFFIGFSFSAWALMITYAQELTSLAFQGRVQSLFNSLSGIMILVFYLILGKANHSFGVIQLYWLEVILMMTAGVILFFLGNKSSVQKI